jgi:hypothetical protein
MPARWAATHQALSLCGADGFWYNTAVTSLHHLQEGLPPMSSITPARSQPHQAALAGWRKWILLSMSLFWLFWCVCGLYNWATACPIVAAQQLVTPTDALTPAIAALAAPSTAVVWSDSHAPVLFDEPITYSHNPIVSFGYRAQYQPNSAIEINQLVSDTNWPIIAAWQFSRAQPATLDQQGDADFATLPLTYQSPLADQQQAGCIHRSADRCRVAYVWAQYGQYLVRIRVAEDDRPLSTSTISAIFQQIDHHITQTLRGSHD